MPLSSPAAGHAETNHWQQLASMDPIRHHGCNATHTAVAVREQSQ
jgi:hypothetical protein